MMRNQVPRPALPALLLLAMLAISFSGCSATHPADQADIGAGGEVGRYFQNRLHDFLDVFQFGIGVASADNESGPWIPILGAHLQVTDFAKIGNISYSGYTAEWDGRGFFAGPERRTRLAFGTWEMLTIDQNYERGGENYFKKSDTRWKARMQSDDMMWRNTPAKELNYAFWSETFHLGLPPFHRGWQHWSNTGFELGAFLFTFRAGVDVSEAFDFVLGWTTADRKHDDLTRSEYKEKGENHPHITGDPNPR
jgi:hypothetical protein